MFNQREVFRGAEIRALVHTTNFTTNLVGVIFGSLRHCFRHFHELKTIENQWFLCDRAWIFMDFPFQPQLLATLAPTSGRVWEC